MIELPDSSILDKAIPKKSFDDFATPKQRQALTSLVSKIRWAYKISYQTVNLQGKDISEIQVFELVLKEKAVINDLILLMDRVIPYPILFVVFFGDEVKYFISQKHPHPTNENQAIVDWTFTCEWRAKTEDDFIIHLADSLDYVYSDICYRVAGKIKMKDKDIFRLTELERKEKQLKSQIEKLTSLMKNCKQFNKKVEMNRELRALMAELSALTFNI